jgi:hypothetical protein
VYFDATSVGISPLIYTQIVAGDANGALLTVGGAAGQIEVIAAPEPGELWLLASAAAWLGLGRRRRTR